MAHRRILAPIAEVYLPPAVTSFLCLPRAADARPIDDGRAFNGETVDGSTAPHTLANACGPVGAHHIKQAHLLPRFL